MDMTSNLVLGLQTGLGTILYCAIGVLLGLISGVLPGVGSAAMVAIMLPFTFGLAAGPALSLLVCVYIGHVYGATMMATLVDSSKTLPRDSFASPDGYQLARLGFAGRVLAVSAIALIVGATAATAFAALVGSSIARLALTFGPAEYFAAIVVTLAASLGFGRSPIIPALGILMLGLLLGLAGIDTLTGTPRLTFGVPALFDGIGFVPVAIGMFAIGELVAYSGEKDRRDLVVTKVANLVPTREDLGRIFAPILRGTAVGSVLGMIPGAGPLLASSASYSLEGTVSKNRDQLGKGAIEGVAAPAASIASAAPTSFIPLLALGIPSSAAMALMMAAMTTFGIAPGAMLLQQHSALFWGTIASVWIGSALLLILVLPLIGVWLRMLTFPYSWVFPAIVAFCAIGAFSNTNSSFDVAAMALFGLLGYVFIKLEFEILPFLLGFMLAPVLEHNLVQALIVGKGSPAAFFERPISAILLAISVLLIAGGAFAQMRRGVRSAPG